MSPAEAQLERKSPLFFEFGLDATVRAGNVTQTYPFPFPFPGYSQPLGQLNDGFGCTDFVEDEDLGASVHFTAWSDAGLYDPIEVQNPIQFAHTVIANSECNVSASDWENVGVALNPKGRVATLFENVGDDGTCDAGFEFWGYSGIGSYWTGSGSSVLTWVTPAGASGGVIVSGDGENVYLFEAGGITTIPNSDFYSYSFPCPKGTQIYLDLFSQFEFDLGGPDFIGIALPQEFDLAGGVLATLTIQ
jgi:hypothetical protein